MTILKNKIKNKLGLTFKINRVGGKFIVFYIIHHNFSFFHFQLQKNAAVYPFYLQIQLTTV